MRPRARLFIRLFAHQDGHLIGLRASQRTIATHSKLELRKIGAVIGHEKGVRTCVLLVDDRNLHSRINLHEAHHHSNNEWKQKHEFNDALTRL